MLCKRNGSESISSIIAIQELRILQGERTPPAEQDLGLNFDRASSKLNDVTTVGIIIREQGKPSSFAKTERRPFDDSMVI